jgi:alpha-mannosidase
MIANRGLPEIEVRRTEAGSEIALTLLRCVGWLSRDDFITRRGQAGPQLPTPGAQMPGKWTFDYSIIPFTSSKENTIPYHLAYGFEASFKAVSTSLHAGLLPSKGSFIEVEPEEFVVSTIKEAEDGKGWIVRGYNITGEAIDVRMRPWRECQRAAVVNLAEEKQADLAISEDGSLTVSVRGQEIVTIRFED